MHTVTLRRFGYLALAAAVATLIVAGLLSLREWRQYQAASAATKKARRTLTVHERLIDLLLDAETGQRGFLLTGKAEYLTPYDQARERIPETLAQAADLANEVPDQSRRFALLRSLILDKLSELESSINTARSYGNAAALALVNTGRGKQDMDRIRSLSRQIQDSQDKQWLASSETLRNTTEQVRMVAILSAALLVVLVAGGGFALRKATQQTEETEGLLRSTLYSIGDGVIVTDAAGSVVMMNAVAARLTGYAESESRGKNVEQIFRIVDEATRETVENPVRKVLRDRKLATLGNHTLLISKNGAAIAIEDCGAPVEAAGSVCRGVVLVFRDVSERKKALAAARRLASIVENSDDAIIGNTLEGIVTSWNVGAERLLGYSQEEMLGKSIACLIPSDRSDEMNNILGQIVKGESLDHYETERIAKDGGRIAVSLTVSPIRNEEGQVVGVSKIARDITRHRQLEETLLQSQKMDAIGRLAGGVAHDFNNLLTVILGYAASLRARIGSEEPLAKMTSEIQRAAEQAAALTGQMLAFSRKQVTQVSVFDLNDAVAEMRNMLQRLIGEDIDLRVATTHSAPCPIKADLGQLSQVLLNLAANARDAMPTGGKLTIETRRVTREWEDLGKRGVRPAGSYVQLVVSDSGVGMDAETQKHIFEPFFTTKDSGKGTGLGLATVYGIVQQHGGWVDVYSEPQHGTTFYIYFPVAQVAFQPAVIAEVAAEPRRPVTILLVEDQAAIRMLAEDVLSDAGHNVLSAPNGRAALGVAAKHKGEIDLLITDVVMPELSGPELAAQLSLVRPNLRILYMSGFTDHALLHRGVIEQGTAFLQKPFLPEALLAKVDEL